MDFKKMTKMFLEGENSMADIREKYLKILNETSMDNATSRATSRYNKASRGREKAIEDYKSGKINESEFTLALRKAGFGESRAKELIDRYKFQHESALERKNAKPAKKPAKPTRWRDEDLGRELGRLILPPRGWNGGR